MFKKLIFITIFIGILIRIIGINVFPVGLNCDEASAAYDAYSILTTLRDRNNIFLPVYLMAWGSGQSALLTYLMLPFIKILGLNLISTRLPMAIVSSISLIVFYKILKTSFDEKDNNKDFYVFFGTLFFALNPWHIMKSRWGLDCNLFPDLVLFGMYFLINYFKSSEKKDIYYVLAFVLFAISAYSYASAYLFLAIFCICIFIYGLRNHRLSKKHLVLAVSITILITWPLILFIVVNFFDLKSIELAFMTIPRLRGNRMLSHSILSNDNVLLSLFNNIISSFKLYIFQYDAYYWNGIKGIGMYYLFSFPVFIVGITNYIKRLVFSNYKKENIVDRVFFIWFISGFVSNLFHLSININRGNIIIIPLVYFIIKGFHLLFYKKIMRGISILLLLISFTYFSYLYIDGNIKKENSILIEGINSNYTECFAVGLEPVITYADGLGAKEVVFYSDVKESYIYVLYYLKTNPQVFYKTRKLYDNDIIFDAVKSFDKWRFDRPDSLAMDKNYVYIFEKEILPIIDTNYFDVKEINDYIVVQYKG